MALACLRRIVRSGDRHGRRPLHRAARPRRCHPEARASASNRAKRTARRGALLPSGHGPGNAARRGGKREFQLLPAAGVAAVLPWWGALQARVVQVRYRAGVGAAWRQFGGAPRQRPPAVTVMTRCLPGGGALHRALGPPQPVQLRRQRPGAVLQILQVAVAVERPAVDAARPAAPVAGLRGARTGVVGLRPAAASVALVQPGAGRDGDLPGPARLPAAHKPSPPLAWLPGSDQPTKQANTAKPEPHSARPPYSPAVGPAGTVWVRPGARRRDGRHIVDHGFPARTWGRRRAAPPAYACDPGWLAAPVTYCASLDARAVPASGPGRPVGTSFSDGSSHRGRGCPEVTVVRRTTEEPAHDRVDRRGVGSGQAQQEPRPAGFPAVPALSRCRDARERRPHAGRARPGCGAAGFVDLRCAQDRSADSRRRATGGKIRPVEMRLP